MFIIPGCGMPPCGGTGAPIGCAGLYGIPGCPPFIIGAYGIAYGIPCPAPMLLF